MKGAHEGEGLGNAFLSHIRATDAIFHVVRVFEEKDTGVTHTEGECEPMRDLDIIRQELRFKDIEAVSNKIPDVQKDVRVARDAPRPRAERGRRRGQRGGDAPPGARPRRGSGPLSAAAAPRAAPVPACQIKRDPKNKKYAEHLATLETALAWLKEGKDVRFAVSHYKWGYKEIDVLNELLLLTAKPASARTQEWARKGWKGLPAARERARTG